MTIGVALRLLAIMGLWAACFPLITIGLDLAPHLAFAAMRAALGGVCLLLLGALFRRPMPRGARTWRLIGVVAFGDTTLGFLGMFHAAEFVSPGLATIIYNAQPPLTAVLAHAVLRERLKALGKAGLVAGFAGIIAIAWRGLASGNVNGYTLGIAYIFLAVTGEAVSNVALKRLPKESDAMMVMGVQLLLGAAPLALPWILQFTTAPVAAWNVWISGGIIAVLAAAALYQVQKWEEWTNAVIGIWLVVSPWVLGFSNDAMTTWNAAIIGLVVLCVAGWELYALPAETRMQH